MTPLTIRDRLAVHRRVEWVRSRGCWPDWLDVQDEGLGALGALADELEAQQQELLLEEIEMELDRLAFAGEGGPASSEPDWFGELAGPPPAWNPSGELCGGRPPMSRLLCRRIDREPEAGDEPPVEAP